MTKKEQQELIFKSWELDREWKKLADPHYGAVTTFKRLDTRELFLLVDIQDKQKAVNTLLRKELGLVKYIYFRLAPVSFYKRYLMNE